MVPKGQGAPRHTIWSCLRRHLKGPVWLWTAKRCGITKERERGRRKTSRTLKLLSMELPGKETEVHWGRCLEGSTMSTTFIATTSPKAFWRIILHPALLGVGPIHTHRTSTKVIYTTMISIGSLLTQAISGISEPSLRSHPRTGLRLLDILKPEMSICISHLIDGIFLPLVYFVRPLVLLFGHNVRRQLSSFNSCVQGFHHWSIFFTEHHRSIATRLRQKLMVRCWCVSLPSRDVTNSFSFATER